MYSLRVDCNIDRQRILTRKHKNINVDNISSFQTKSRFAHTMFQQSEPNSVKDKILTKQIRTMFPSFSLSLSLSLSLSRAASLSLFLSLSLSVCVCVCVDTQCSIVRLTSLCQTHTFVHALRKSLLCCSWNTLNCLQPCRCVCVCVCVCVYVRENERERN